MINLVGFYRLKADTMQMPNISIQILPSAFYLSLRMGHEAIIFANVLLFWTNVLRAYEPRH